MSSGSWTAELLHECGLVVPLARGSLLDCRRAVAQRIRHARRLGAQVRRSQWGTPLLWEVSGERIDFTGELLIAEEE